MKNILEIAIQKRDSSVLHQYKDLVHGFVPELYGFSKSEGHKDNYWHTLAVCQNAMDAGVCDMDMMLVCIFHDLGKEKTKAHNGKTWTFHGHEAVSAKMFSSFWKKHGSDFSGVNPDLVYDTIFNHGRPKELTEKKAVTDSAVRRMVTEMGGFDHFEFLMNFCLADMTSSNQAKIARMKTAYFDLMDRAVKIQKDDSVRTFQPKLNGNIISQEFGVVGDEIGKLKGLLKDAILRGEVEDSVEAGIDYLKRISTGA